MPRAGVGGTLDIETIEHVARVTIGPARANPDQHGAVDLTVHAFDVRNRPVTVAGLVRWTAHDGRIDDRGRLLAGERDATVTATVGGTHATVTIPVGRHDVPLALFDDAHRAGWQPAATPANGSGASIAVDADRLQIGYDFTAGVRAVYATSNVAVGSPLAISCAVDGDAGGAALRASIADRYGDRQTLTLTRAIDFSGTHRLAANVPPSLAPPLAIRSFYVVATLANPPIATAGTIGVHDCTASVPGSAETPASSQPR